MSDSNRANHAFPVIVFGAFLIMGAMMLASKERESMRSVEPAAASAEVQSQNAFDPAVRTDFTEDRDAAASHQDSELKAQWRAANSGWAGVWVSFGALAGLAITAYFAYLAWREAKRSADADNRALRLARKQIREARRAAAAQTRATATQLQALESAAKAGWAAVKAQSDSASAQQAAFQTSAAQAAKQLQLFDEQIRPYVFVIPAEPPFWDWHDGRENFSWPFQIVNFGQSPAILKIVTYGIALEEQTPLLGHGTPPWFADLDRADPRRKARDPLNLNEANFPGGPPVLERLGKWSPEIAPMSVHKLTPGSTREDIVATRAALNHDAPYLFWHLIVRVEYEGPSGAKLHTNACVRIQPRGAALQTEEVGGPEYNSRA